MRKPLKVWISRSTEEYSKALDLPATYEEIHEVLERVGVTVDNCLIEQCEFEVKSMRLANVTVNKPNIYELNHLATMLNDMDWMERKRFAGAATISKQTATADLINIAMNVKTLENIECYPASNDYELGEFFIENGLVEQIEEMTQEQREWTVEFINYETLGEVMRERERGVFKENAYIVMSEELKSLYDGIYSTPIPVDHVFKLRVELAPNIYTVFGIENNDINSVDLKFPTTDEKFRNTIKQIGAKSINDCVFYDLKSVVPQFEGKFENTKDFENLNQLAINLQFFRENNELLTYKAMLETLHNPTLETALELCEYVCDFTLNQNVIHSEEYARAKLQSLDIPMKENLLDVTNLKRYGNDLMKNDGVELTPYGVLISSDGMTLTEKMEQAQTRSQGMTMGGISR